MILMNDNTYYANVGLLWCPKCNSEAIISIERAKSMQAENLYCPYCKNNATKIIAQTTDDDRAEYEFGKFTLCERRR